MLYQKAFLQDLAEQNFSKYGVSYTGPVVSVSITILEYRLLSAHS